MTIQLYTTSTDSILLMPVTHDCGCKSRELFESFKNFFLLSTHRANPFRFFLKNSDQRYAYNWRTKLLDAFYERQQQQQQRQRGCSSTSSSFSSSSSSSAAAARHVTSDNRKWRHWHQRCWRDDDQQSVDCHVWCVLVFLLSP